MENIRKDILHHRADLTKKIAPPFASSTVILSPQTAGKHRITTMKRNISLSERK